MLVRVKGMSGSLWVLASLVAPCLHAYTYEDPSADKCYRICSGKRSPEPEVGDACSS